MHEQENEFEYLMAENIIDSKDVESPLIQNFFKDNVFVTVNSMLNEKNLVFRCEGGEILTVFSQVSKYYKQFLNLLLQIVRRDASL